MNVRLLVVLFLTLCAQRVVPQHISRRSALALTVNNGLPSGEVKQVFVDSRGLLWVATSYGYCVYDGYTCRTLGHANVQCFAEDAAGRLWFGTIHGVEIYDLRTDELSRPELPDIYNKGVSCLLAQPDGDVWIGTESGLVIYDHKRQRYLLQNDSTTQHVLSATPIKCLMRDSRGDTWIGTWERGLYRYASQARRFIAYPQMNDRRSAHVLHEDAEGNIWIASWAGGLTLLLHPYDMERLTWCTLLNDPADPTSLGSNFVYSMHSDPVTGDLWVGTMNGLSVLCQADKQRMTTGERVAFTNYSSTSWAVGTLPATGINSMAVDKGGDVWLGSVYEGVMRVTRTSRHFQYLCVPDADHDLMGSSVACLTVDADARVWWGLATNGFAIVDPVTQQMTHYSSLPEFRGQTLRSGVRAFLRRRATGEMWVGTQSDGIFTMETGQAARHYDKENCDFLRDNSIRRLLEDKAGNVWIGCKAGLSLLRADGSGYCFNQFDVDGHDFLISEVTAMAQDGSGAVWVGTRQDGLVRIQGNVMGQKDMKLQAYARWNRRMPTSGISDLLVDADGRLWVATFTDGIFCYDAGADSLQHVRLPLRGSSQRISSLGMDRKGNVWLTTSAGLATFDPQNPLTSLRHYGSEVGLLSGEFAPGVVASDGRFVYFGGTNGITYFDPAGLNEEPQRAAHTYIVDIAIDRSSLLTMGAAERATYCKASPLVAQEVNIPADGSFTLYFSSLDYQVTQQTQYEWRLEGVDVDWQLSTDGQNSITYSRLPGGDYTFCIRCTNEMGEWSDDYTVLRVHVASHWWTTLWARLIYIIGIVALIAFVVWLLVRHARMRQSLYRQRVEQENSERFAQAKMKFLTNITHELLTPLTIISASVDQLRQSYSQGQELYDVITYNVKRQLRLLQQVLEYRKSETGNLRLRVSYGDMSAMVRKMEEEFQPLMRRQQLQFACQLPAEAVFALFDRDKVEKILYNLLSNAAKYNRPGGHVSLRLERGAAADTVLLTVSDDGAGIPADRQRSLFQRFYEGEHRRYDTQGNGIGLSLTYDLVQLHHGSITFESEEGRGTIFSVTLPVGRAAFADEEVDNEFTAPPQPLMTVEEPIDDEPDTHTEPQRQTVLLVEDDPDFLRLMRSLLAADYTVLTATNGREAIETVRTAGVDLVVSDVMMSEMDGIHLCKYLKNSVDYCHIPFLLLTALHHDEAKIEAFDAGADGYLTKPFDMALLQSRMRNLFRHAALQSERFRSRLASVAELTDVAEGEESMDQAFMTRLMDAISANLDNPDYDRQRLQDDMCMSRSSLFRKVKALTGMSPSTLLRKCRLEKARRLIESGRVSRVTDLAYRVGFGDAKYFSAVFKREYGLLPAEMVQKVRHDKPNEGQASN
ncbi:MAG: response regulator [Bacteroidaceae bacterium]|nr:response regulator [Bacteroidaceae bacterium]